MQPLTVVVCHDAEQEESLSGRRSGGGQKRYRHLGSHLLVHDGEGLVVISLLTPIMCEMEAGYGEDGPHQIVAVEANLHKSGAIELARGLAVTGLSASRCSMAGAETAATHSVTTGQHTRLSASVRHVVVV